MAAADCRSSYALIISFLVAMILALAMTTPPAFSRCLIPIECEINLSYYMRQVMTEPDRNQETMVSSSYPQGFGTIVIQDWTISETFEPNAPIIARSKGIDVEVSKATGVWYTSVSIVFEDARFKGSSFEAMGIISQGQLAIIGGTGQFATARGTVNFTVIQETSHDNYRLIDIHAYILQAGNNADDAGKAAIIL